VKKPDLVKPKSFEVFLLFVMFGRMGSWYRLDSSSRK